MKRVLIMLCVLLVLTFSGLRVYGAYETEKQDALRRAGQAQQASKVEQAEADDGEAEIKCSLAWGNYHLAEQKAETARITERPFPSDHFVTTICRLAPSPLSSSAILGTQAMRFT